MKFSILLPTRNGAAFLRPCIASVLQSEYLDMELVISDNASEDETPEIVRAFAADPRLRSVRLPKAVPVTDNWINALEASRGDYFVLIGDDDYLLPEYFPVLARAVEQHGRPDCLIYNGYTYVFPGAIDGNAASYYGDPHFRFGREFQPGIIGAELRACLVRDLFRFRVRVPLNLQLYLVSRRAASRIRGGAFQPPFPDHYAITALLLDAVSIAYHPHKLVVIGVSPKSFGHYVYSDRHTEGMSYLGSEAFFEGRLPGNELLNAMYRWLALVQCAYPDRLGDMRISRDAYVRRQVFAWAMQLRFGSIGVRELLARSARLSTRDWLGLLLSLSDPAALTSVRRLFGAWRGDRVRARLEGLTSLPEVRSIDEFARFVTESSW